MLALALACRVLGWLGSAWLEVAEMRWAARDQEWACLELECSALAWQVGAWLVWWSEQALVWAWPEWE